jgi:hypothetical protein
MPVVSMLKRSMRSLSARPTPGSSLRATLLTPPAYQLPARGLAAEVRDSAGLTMSWAIAGYVCVWVAFALALVRDRRAVRH